jgi:hypothetical protein
MTAKRLNFLVAGVFTLLACSCGQQNQFSSTKGLACTDAVRQADKVVPFTETVRQADKIAVYEGLPHQFFEPRALEKERRTKAVQDLNGYPFYQQPLTLDSTDAKRLSEILGDSATYKPFAGEKKCGGYHPDYAVEWSVSSDRYRALICFGCYEVKLFGPGLESHNDLDLDAYKRLKELLKPYQKNRPAFAPEQGD